VVGTETSFGASGVGLFVVKFDSAGALQWQRFLDGAEGDAVAVAPDGSVFAAGTRARDQLGNFDLIVLKISSAGALTWLRDYAAGSVADPRGGMAAAADGSVFIAGALQSVKANTPDITALILKIDTDGNLVFDKQFDGRVNETGDGIAVAADDGSVYVTGSTTSFGAGQQDSFVLHLPSTGKKLLDAVTWGGPAFEQGGGVGVSGGASCSRPRRPPGRHTRCSRRPPGCR